MRINKIDIKKLDNDLHDRKISAESKKSYQTDIRMFKTFLKINRLKFDEKGIKEYFDTVKEDYKPATLNRKRFAILKYIKRHFSSDPIKKLLAENTIKNIVGCYKVNRKVNKHIIISPETVNNLTQKAEELNDLKLCYVIKFLWTTGCRVSEMINIKITDIILKDYVICRIVGKGSKERTVEIPKDMYLMIREVFDGKKYLFETRVKTKYHRQNIAKILKKLKCDFPVYPHLFRHSKATFLLDKGMDIKLVSQLLGHSSISITADHYLHNDFNYQKMFDLDKEVFQNAVDL